MYNNNINMPQSQTPYYSYGGYGNTVNPYGNRPIQMEPQPIQGPTYVAPSVNYIKGRPVVSIEEARASQIDLDGSMYVFTDIGNKKIYTKQINLDGTATLNTYVLVEEDVAAAPEYVTKSEFNQALTQIQTMFNSKEEEKKSVASNF